MSSKNWKVTPCKWQIFLLTSSIKQKRKKKLLEIIYTIIQIHTANWNREMFINMFLNSFFLRSFKWFATKVWGRYERFKLRKSCGICNSIIIISTNIADHNNRWFSECYTTDAILNEYATIFCDIQRCEIYGSSSERWNDVPQNWR